MATVARVFRDRVITLTLGAPPRGSTDWSARRLGARVDMSRTTV
jgi:hypothetical protein